MLVSESFFIWNSSTELQMGGVRKRGLPKWLEGLLGENEHKPEHRKKVKYNNLWVTTSAEADVEFTRMGGL